MQGVALSQFLNAHSSSICAQLTSVRGSSPREAGTFMVIAADALIGTIGGGALEHLVIDRARGIGSGLSTIEAGLRLRYEASRRCAPYVGLVRERAFGATARFRRDEGERAAPGTELVAGLRVWF